MLANNWSRRKHTLRVSRRAVFILVLLEGREGGGGGGGGGGALDKR